jgi:Fic family protein
MEEASRVFRSNAHDMSPSLHRRELERFVIEFSWKSSKIEGNTYSLIDTEFLLRNGIEAEGKSKYEAKMILNHKKAYLFAVESMRENVPINTAYIEQLHRYVTDGLGVEHGVRDRIVGITGSRYTPLAMKQQLKEQLIALSEAIASRKKPYEQALVAVLGLSYLQPFEDGNKRTARVLANSLLLRHNYAPLSYRSVDEREYKEATLIFYEQNSIQPFRELFVEQYVYSATHYNIAL